MEIEIITVIGDKVNNGHGKERSKEIDGAFSFWSDGVGASKTRFVEVDVFKLITWFEDNLPLGIFVNGELRKELF